MYFLFIILDFSNGFYQIFEVFMAVTCRLAYTDYLRIQHMKLLFASSRSSAFSRLQHLVLLLLDHLKSQINATKKLQENKFSGAFCMRLLANYLFENCGARRAALRPYFFLSFIRGSLVRYPAFLRAGLYSASASRSALEIPCLIAPA